MFQFLTKFFGSHSDSDSSESKLVAEMVKAADSLDIQTAIAAHENWKMRLEMYLNGTSQETFVPEVICFDDKCELGKWIHGSGKSHLGTYSGFTALMNHHKLFHYAASNVVALTHAGKKEEAEKILTIQFEGFSKMVVSDLKRIQSVIEHSEGKASATQ